MIPSTTSHRDSIIDSEGGSYSEAGTSQLSKRSRGRPRLSKLSLPFSEADMKYRAPSLVFMRELEYNKFVEDIKANTDCNLKKKYSDMFFYKLKDGVDTCKQLREVLNISSKIVDEVRARRTGAIDVHRSKIVSGFSSTAQDVLRLTSGMMDRIEIGIKKDKVATPKFRAVQMRLIHKMKYREISAETSLSIATCHNAVSNFIKSPQLYAEKLSLANESDVFFVSDAKERLIDITTSGSSALTNKKELIVELRKLVRPGMMKSDSSVFEAAKEEMSISKQVPKKTKAIIRDAFRIFGEETVRLAILKLFYVEQSMAIFDSTTFAANHTCSKVWSVAGNRPQVSFPAPSKFFHAHMLITQSSIQAVAIGKGSTTTADIRNFFITGLEKVKYDNFGVVPFKFVLLDNAPVHSETVIKEIAHRYQLIFIFNLPNNPSINPIEWLFGSIKAGFRKAICGRSSFGAEEIVETVAKASKRSFSKTMAACLKEALT